MKRSIMAATIVAVFAIVGGAFAAASITGRDIKNNTITGQDVKNRSLTTGDLSSGAVRSLRGNTGPQGSAGPQGPVGPTVVGQITQVETTFVTGPGAIGTGSVACPPGQRVISGGFFSDSGYAFIDKTYDRASWSIGIDNSAYTTSANTTITASCAPAGQAVAAMRMTRSRRNARVAQDVAKRGQAKLR